MFFHRGGAGDGGHKSIPMSTVTSNVHASTYYQSSMGGLQGERLHQIVVFEIREDGNTQYLTMTLRSLYNYVVRTITEGCREANKKKQRQQQQMEQQHQQHQQKLNNRNTMLMYGGTSTREKFSNSDIFLEEDDEEDSDSSAGVNNPDVEDMNMNGSSNHQEGPTDNETNDSSFPMTPKPSDARPPHYLPSLMSSSNTDDGSNQILSATDTAHDETLEQQHHHQQQQQSDTEQPQHHDVQHIHIPETHRAKPLSWRTTSMNPSPLLPASTTNTYRERLGGYLHPRDMRRLVTPFSSSNEPQLIVRRHVMLLNFDPLRAIVLRDRLLVLVPDGADSILIALEQRVRGGVNEMVNQVFGTTSMHDTSFAGGGGAAAGWMKKSKSYEQQFAKGVGASNKASSSAHENFLIMESSVRVMDCSKHSEDEDNETYVTASSSDNNNLGQGTTTDEWEELQRMDWQHLPFELQSVDAVLQTVMSMLIEDAQKVHDKAGSAMGELRGDSPNKGGTVGDYAQSRLRLHKDAVNLTQRRVQGFIRAMNELLDEDEDMALMNLSRLITHPERFVQPVSRVILHEESDEPELILEAYLQQALSIVNSLDLLKGQILTTEEQISMTLDAIRNRLLYINTLLSVAMLCVATGAFIGSIFGMNLYNHIETDETAFYRVTYGTLAGIGVMWVILSWVFFQAANIQSNWGKKNA
jgi:magnesium transporter